MGPVNASCYYVILCCHIHWLSCIYSSAIVVSLKVLLISQFLLLQTTPPQALIRVRKSNLKDQYEKLYELYMTQHHGSIDDFLNYHLSHDPPRGGLLIQVWGPHYKLVQQCIPIYFI